MTEPKDPSQLLIHRSAEGLKWCHGCDQEKTQDAFGRDRSRPDGLDHRCKTCVSLRNKTYRLANPDKFAFYKLREACMKYGITVKDYFAMRDAQNNVCKICLKPQLGKRLAIDHCHVTGRVRGLLCDGCNGGLGLFRDDVQVMQTAIDYILSEGVL